VELIAAIRRSTRAIADERTHRKRKIVHSFQQPVPNTPESQSLSPREAEVLEPAGERFCTRRSRSP